jgi:hypothetical protein
MITRGQVRRSLKNAGLVAGAIGLLVGVMSLFGTFEVATKGHTRVLSVGLGAIQYRKSATNYEMQVLRSPPPGGFPPPTPVAGHMRFNPANGFPWHMLPKVSHKEGIILPWWMLVALGLFCVYRLLPDERTLQLCPKCCFDLSRTPPMPDSPDSRRCPECGKISSAGARRT